MKKTILESIEKAVTVAIQASSCMGFTLFAWFILKLALPEVTERHLWVCFVSSVFLTFALDGLLTFVGMEIMAIYAEEMENQDDEETARLLEHLEVK